jgi:AcrR family transcriptional regulator
MPRPPEAMREEVRSESRQRLLQAAAVAFAQEGYVGANINHISRAAGFAKGTVYNYFPSKRALMLTLIDTIAEEHIDFVLQAVEPEDEPGQCLERLFSAGFRFVEDHLAEVQVIINTVYGPDGGFRQRVYEAYDRLFTTVIDIVSAGVGRGEFRPVDPELAVALLMSVYLGSCSQIDDEGKVWLDPKQMVTLILEGLRRRDDQSENVE